ARRHAAAGHRAHRARRDHHPALPRARGRRAGARRRGSRRGARVSWAVPLTDVAVTDEDVAAVADCLRSGWLTMGPRTQAFEQAVAEWTDAPHAVAVSNATAALHLALRALGVPQGDEVIVPAFSFVAATHAARYVRATPVLCDVVSATAPTIDPEDVAGRITGRTRAVVAVHRAVSPADVRALREVCEPRGVPVVEDAAQAFGA